ncbi:MAG: AAA family ATPase [Anaerolineales bacterium]|nr:AAA family ATPase [Anaerolineales bacterium]
MELWERETELRALAAAWAEARDGAGRVALVSGEAGIGKSALIERFAQGLPGAPRVLWGVCDALFTPRPFGPLHDVAAQLDGPLAALLDTDGDRTAIFTATLGALHARPIVLVFEDAHWADEATLDLLKYLGRRIQRTRALLILTYRDDELGPKHPLRTLLGDMATSSAIRRLTLKPLTVDAVRALIGPRVVNADVLHRQTGGNPFFLTEVLSNPGGVISPTARDAVLSRVARLSPPGRNILRTVAVVGPRIEAWALSEIAGPDARAVDECLAVGMLVAQSEALTFRHELARQAVLETVPPQQILALHRRALAVLQSVPNTREDWTRIAHHAEGADDRAAILAAAPPAARLAASAGAHRAAVAWYERAIQAAEGLPATERAGLIEAHAWECNFIGQHALAAAGRREAAALWRDAGVPRKQGENLAHLALTLASEQMSEAWQACRDAVAVLEEAGPGVELALAYRVQAMLHLFNHDYAEAIAVAEHAVALAEPCGDARVLAMALDTLGTGRLYIDYEQGRATLERCLIVAREAKLEPRVATVYANLGSTAAELFRLDEAERYLSTGYAYTTARDLDAIRTYILGWQATVHLLRGRWDAAEGAAREALNHALVSAANSIPARLALGRLRARRGDPEAAATLADANTLAQRSGDFQNVGPAAAVQAEAAWLAGDLAGVLSQTQAAYQLALGKRHPWIAGELLFWLRRAGEVIDTPDWIAEPFARHIAGDWHVAAKAWESLGCPFEQARALSDGDTPAQLEALAIFERLGVRIQVEALRERLRTAGIAAPRGPRAATRENPFGLTMRQMEILHLLGEGLSNGEIAARLHLSPKTVDHHVSAVFAKLDVHSREEAAARIQSLRH